MNYPVMFHPDIVDTASLTHHHHRPRAPKANQWTRKKWSSAPDLVNPKKRDLNLLSVLVIQTRSPSAVFTPLPHLSACLDFMPFF